MKVSTLCSIVMARSSSRIFADRLMNVNVAFASFGDPSLCSMNFLDGLASGGGASQEAEQSVEHILRLRDITRHAVMKVSQPAKGRVPPQEHAPKESQSLPPCMLRQVMRDPLTERWKPKPYTERVQQQHFDGHPAGLTHIDAERVHPRHCGTIT